MSALERKISKILSDEAASSATVEAVIGEVTTAISEAEQVVAQTRATAVDDLDSDPETAASAMALAEVKANRLKNALPRLQRHYQEIVDQEQSRAWRKEFAEVEAKRNVAATEFATAYPKLVDQLLDLITRAQAVDREISRVNGSAPRLDGAHARLRTVEQVARDAGGLTDAPSVTVNLKLPSWEKPNELAYPMHQQFVVPVILPNYDPRSTSGDWHAAIATVTNK